MLGRRKSAPANPWTASMEPAAVVVDERLEPDELMGARIAIEGPPVPVELDLGGRPRTLRRGSLAADGRLYVVNLHGGAGATTVTRLLGESTAIDADRIVPQLALPTPPRVLFVARTHGAGLAAAKAAAQEWAAGDLRDVDLIGLVLVADGPKLTRKLRADALAVAGLTPRCWRIGWQEQWREQAVADTSRLSARLRRVLGDIHTRATAHN